MLKTVVLPGLLTVALVCGQAMAQTDNPAAGAPPAADQGAPPAAAPAPAGGATARAPSNKEIIAGCRNAARAKGLRGGRPAVGPPGVCGRSKSQTRSSNGLCSTRAGARSRQGRRHEGLRQKLRCSRKVICGVVRALNCIVRPGDGPAAGVSPGAQRSPHGSEIGTPRRSRARAPRGPRSVSRSAFGVKGGRVESLVAGAACRIFSKSNTIPASIFWETECKPLSTDRDMSCSGLLGDIVRLGVGIALIYWQFSRKLEHAQRFEDRIAKLDRPRPPEPGDTIEFADGSSHCRPRLHDKQTPPRPQTPRRGLHPRQGERYGSLTGVSVGLPTRTRGNASSPFL